MTKNLLQVLESVGYKGPLLEDKKLSSALELGPKSTEYTSLIAWFAEQIRTFTDIEETIHPTSTPEDASSFLLELSCFLKEIGCINQNLTTGNVNQRLSTRESKILLLEILIAELMACKLLEAKNPEINQPLTCSIVESATAKHLKNMLIALQFPKPPPNITTEMLLSKLENKLKEVISKVPKDLLGQPLFFGKLSNDQWDKLCNYDEELRTEYEIRRNMLLTRLDVTIQSFLWSERVRAQEKELNKKYQLGMSQMDIKPNVHIADLLAARDDLAVMEKTSNAAVRKNTRSSINKVIIGDVPDRGGRAYEQEPPPPEMPPWQKDRVAGPPSSGGYNRGGNTGGSGGRGGGGGARGGGRGGRGGSGANYGNNAGYGNSGGGGYVNIGYASAGDGYSGSNNYMGGEGSNSYGGGNYVGGGGGSNYNNSNYSGGASYGNNRGRGNYYNSGGTSNRTSGAYQDYNDTSGNYGQDYQHNSGRGGRVQGGWNQGGHNSARNDYQRDGYNRGRGRGKRQY